MVDHRNRWWIVGARCDSASGRREVCSFRVPIIPVQGFAWAVHPPAKCSMSDSPTATQRATEVQLTAVNGWGDVTAVGARQGRVRAPVTMTRPAWGARATELPTVTQVPIETHDTAASEADKELTVWLDQVAPPLSVVKINPCPSLAVVNVFELVPTTVQRTPATPTTGVVGWGTVDVVVVDVVVVLPPGTAGGDVVDVVEVVGGTGRAPPPVGGPARQETPLR